MSSYLDSVLCKDVVDIIYQHIHKKNMKDLCKELKNVCNFNSIVDTYNLYKHINHNIVSDVVYRSEINDICTCYMTRSDLGDIFRRLTDHQIIEIITGEDYFYNFKKEHPCKKCKKSLLYCLLNAIHGEIDIIDPFEDDEYAYSDFSLLNILRKY